MSKKRQDHVFNHSLKKTLEGLADLVQELLDLALRDRDIHGAKERSDRLRGVLTTIRKGLIDNPAFDLVVPYAALIALCREFCRIAVRFADEFFMEISAIAPTARAELGRILLRGEGPGVRGSGCITPRLRPRRINLGSIMFPPDLLRRIRNDLPMHLTLACLGKDAPPSKWSEGYFRFLCPRCAEMRATVNPRNNLAHCFACNQNTNNIDLLLALDYPFTSAIALLEQWLNEHQARYAK